MSADKKSNQSQIAQATLDESNQSVKVTVVANEAASIAADMNLESIDGNPVSVGAGVVTSGTQRVVLASNQPTIPVDIQDTTLAVSLDYTEDSITIHAPNNNTTPIPISGSVNVSQVGGNAIATGSGSTNSGTQRVVLANDQLPLPVTGSFSATVTSAAVLDVFGTTIVGGRNNQIEINFNTAPGVGLITNTTSGGASVTHTNGHALYSTGTGLTALAKGVSVQKTDYRPAHEIYSFFTAAFTTPTSAASSQRIGLYDASNGFFLGYEGLTFGVTKRTNGVDTFTPASSFNSDLLNGLSLSTFTRNGIAEAINYGFSNLYRIRFAWLGSANVLFEVFSPDGKWVVFHNIRQPNTSVNPSILNPDLPMTVEVSKTASDTTNLTVYSACWAAGTTSELDNLTATLNDNSLAALNRSVITGQTSAGGGGYVNVKVTPSGSLTTAIGDITGIVGQQTMANSVPVVIASNQSAVPASQSGTWNIGSVTSLPSIPAGNNNIGDVDVVSVPAPLNLVGSGTGTSALRVQLADESLSALENINITVTNEVEVKNDSGNPVPVSQSGTWNINNISGTVTLPTDASKYSEQLTQTNKLDSISGYSEQTRTSLNQLLNIVATSAKQDAANIDISAIKTSVDQVENLLTLILNDSAAINAKVSTAAKQDTGNASLSSIDSKVATAAKQDTANTSLASIDTKVATAANQALEIVELQAIKGYVDAVETKLDTLITQTDDVESSLTSIDTKVSTSANQVTANASLASIDTKTPALGQALMAASQPVVLASNHSAILVTTTPSATYSAGITDLLLSTTATDAFTISGSGTKVIKVRKIVISGHISGNTTTINDICLVKRSSANTGGTSTVSTNVAYDSQNSAATAVVRSYTVNPTALGTEVGTFGQTNIVIGPNSTGANNPIQYVPVIYDFTAECKQPIVLRGISEFLCLNFTGTVPASTSFEIYIEWTEE